MLEASSHERAARLRTPVSWNNGPIGVEPVTYSTTITAATTLGVDCSRLAHQREDWVSHVGGTGVVTNAQQRQAVTTGEGGSVPCE